MAQLKGQQIVGAAANGVDVNFGTSADTLDDTDMLAGEDVSRIYQQGYQNVRGRDINAANYMGEASAQRTAGKATLVTGAFGVGSSVLGGATQFRDLKNRLGAWPKPVQMGSGIGGGRGNWARGVF